MNRKTFSALFLASLAGLAVAGPINPPGGPVAPTGKTLIEVEPRVALDQQYAPGDMDAQFKITNSGSYYSTGSMTILSGRAYLEIAASNVTVDLSGFRINGSTGTLDGIFIAPGVTNVKIRNGTIVNFAGDGIDMTGVSGCVIENVTIATCAGTGLRAGTGAIVRGVIANGNGGDGFNLAGGSTAAGCTAKSNTGNGFFASGPASINDCAARENGVNGFYITSGTNVESCEAFANLQRGVDCVSGSELMRVTDSTFVSNAQGGITITNGSLVKGNTISSPSGDIGIYVIGSGNRIEGNTTRGPGSSVSCLLSASVVDNFIIANWHHSTNGTNGFASVNAAGNVVGPVVTANGTITTTNPWANFSR